MYDEPFELQDRKYVLVATSDARETFKYENRKKFIRYAQEIAGERDLVFKLHPNEDVKRATQEIAAWAPEAFVYHGRSIDPMIAHCDALVTRFSTVVYIGMALGKTVYSEFPLEQLKRMTPIQNGGLSALNIASVCEEVLQAATLTIPVPQAVTAYGNVG